MTNYTYLRHIETGFVLIDGNAGTVDLNSTETGNHITAIGFTIEQGNGYKDVCFDVDQINALRNRDDVSLSVTELVELTTYLNDAVAEELS